ncbi:MAG: hypothetical protein HW419_3711 [Deltaproteobacteria bacterium]|nr:hypothetical protein [Deltaproteobacteria bacterium]
MNTKSIIQVGIALIFLAIAAFIYPGVTYTSREQLVDFGPVQAIAEIYKILPLSPLMGGLLLVGGIVLVVVGVKKSS